MIDLLKLMIPFQPEHLITTVNADYCNGVYINLEDVARRAGLKLNARHVEYEIDGDLRVTGLSHPFESLPSSFGSLAMKIHPGARNLHPAVEIKASPAKLLQGHHVFGSTDIEVCAKEMIYILCSSLPDLFAMLDPINTDLDWIDVTNSGHVEREAIAKQVIAAFKNVSSGQMKQNRKSKDHETTMEWNTGSRHKSTKVYLKGFELINNLNEYKKKLKIAPKNTSYQNIIEVMSNPDLIEFAQKCVRFEARFKQRYLFKMGVPANLWQAIEYQKTYEQDGKNLINDLWSAAFHELFSALEGSTMTIYTDDQVMDKLKSIYFKITPKGNVSYAKAQRLFGFYRRLTNEGYQNVYDSMDRATFKRSLDDLLLIGLSKVQLQNLHADKSNVIPLVRVINVDFSNQRPNWYVEPKSRFDNDNVVLFNAA